MGTGASAGPRRATESASCTGTCCGAATGNRARRSGRSMVDDIIARDPDIVVLSEAPPLTGMYDGFRATAGATVRTLDRERHLEIAHAYHLYVLARWPVHLDSRVGIVNGDAAMVVIDHPAQPIRLLVVDGQSKISRLRTPMLHDIARGLRPAWPRRRSPSTSSSATSTPSVARSASTPEPCGRRVPAGLALVAGLEGDMAFVLPGLRHRSRLGPQRLDDPGLPTLHQLRDRPQGPVGAPGPPAHGASRMKRTVLLGTTLCTIEVRTRRSRPALEDRDDEVSRNYPD